MTEKNAVRKETPNQTTDENGWRDSCDRFLVDLEALKELVGDPTTSGNWPSCARSWGFGLRGTAT